MAFARLTLSNWKQFADVDIRFHPRATIITGTNGSGKTTILSLLALHAGSGHTSLATPRVDLDSQRIKYSSLNKEAGEGRYSDRYVGSLTYTNDFVARFLVSPGHGAIYHVGLENLQNTRAFCIGSHRMEFSYKRIKNIATAYKGREAAFGDFVNVLYQSQQGGSLEQPTSLVMKNILVGWVINGYGVTGPEKAIVLPDPIQIKHFEGFRDVLRLILPQSLGFEDIEVRDYEIVFCCNGGSDDFLLEAASGGISALIDIAWQIYMFDTEDKKMFSVLIDEVENHLHPSLQRTLLPNLLSAFPHANFIVSTHSPLVVTSVEDSYVYALKYDDTKKVRSYLLDFKSEVKNAIDILDGVLGVSTTMPAWAVAKLTAILQKHTNSDPTTESLASLRSELEDAGLRRLFPQAIGEIAEARK